jgi:hypothetical protein
LGESKATTPVDFEAPNLLELARQLSKAQL